MALIEVCAYSVQSAIIAQLGGAKRVELCTNPFEGGTTPSFATIELAREKLDIDMFVIIRPRGGDFCYSKLEFDNMLLDIHEAKRAVADGIVSGVLNYDGTIDFERTKQMIEEADPLPFTFHRAFDFVPDPFKAIDKLKEIGVKRILTSGQAENAMKGKDILKKLIDYSKGEIIIMPGGGINSGNISELKNFTRAKEFHLSAKKIIESKQIMNGSIKDIGLNYFESDIEEITKVVEITKSII
jgi:copper homeostasis protein